MTDINKKKIRAIHDLYNFYKKDWVKTNIDKEGPGSLTDLIETIGCIVSYENSK